MKQILAAIDFSEKTDVVLAQAMNFASALDAKLWVMHVAVDLSLSLAYESSQFTGYTSELLPMPGDIELDRTVCADEIRRKHARLLDISSQLRKEGVETQAILLKGDAVKLILEKSKELKIDLLILGSHGHGLLHKALLGSVSEAVIRHAACNVMIVPVSGQ